MIKYGNFLLMCPNPNKTKPMSWIYNNSEFKYAKPVQWIILSKNDEVISIRSFEIRILGKIDNEDKQKNYIKNRINKGR